VGPDSRVGGERARGSSLIRLVPRPSFRYRAWEPAGIPFPRGMTKRMPVLLRTVLLLALSNVFMTFAWYAHLKDLKRKPWLIAALFSWGVALFEYLIQVPPTGSATPGTAWGS